MSAKSWIYSYNIKTKGIQHPNRAKEQSLLSPLAGSNRGPQDSEFTLLLQLQSCALPAELRRVDERDCSRDDTGGSLLGYVASSGANGWRTTETSHGSRSDSRRRPMIVPAFGCGKG
jgi:hypothetical protein